MIKKQMLWSISFFLAMMAIVILLQGQRELAEKAHAQHQAQLQAEVAAVMNQYVPAVNTGLIKPGLACDSPIAQRTQIPHPQELARQLPKYHPKEIWKKADPSNYGPRLSQDIQGKPVNNPLLIVLHETVGSIDSALSIFQAYNPRDADQVSYHTMIALDGTVVYVVPPEARAYGAGNSEFNGESVLSSTKVPSSVNNFAYHISLETPADGMNERDYHSGYTDAQYRSLAWLVARTRVQPDRIVSHKDVDRDGARSDPRSFDQAKFLGLLDDYQILFTTHCTLTALGNPRVSINPPKSNLQ
ncbi:N-acetylmuramoyl-L-alanine amidase [Synechococcus sp. PCC 6312]|uniref:N-acetylmuramoyl-L-alanine amidase n=1 Tax=Synechococcus sp. (strain ATCC 27167 / PCC 6312) TaxID=195253 RepID=UPI00029ED53E|nr:peptidoglycan recognition family protein [Synechococcus sp. PCC 6312]AFY59313.1 negative regulator of beta-lactamase expression [Synechococcus sp. PCC 6312]